MKAIYKKPETEIVNLQVQEDITAEWGDLARPSNTKNVGQSNSNFFEDEPNNNGNGSFFDD